MGEIVQVGGTPRKIVFRKFSKLPKQMRRDVAGFALSCAKRVCAGLENTEHDDFLKTRHQPIFLAVGFIHMVEEGLGQIVIENGAVYLRMIDGIEVHAVH